MVDSGPVAPFALSVAERASLPPEIDPEALERLLAQLPTDARSFIIRFCRATAATTEGELRALLPECAADSPDDGGRGFLPPQLDDLAFDDPELTLLLHAVTRTRGSGPSSRAV